MKDRLTPPPAGELGLSVFYKTADLFRCDTCPNEVHLFVRRQDGRIACAECWQAAGSPFPREAVTPEVLFAIEQQTRERMKKRGGTARHLVNAGKA